MTLPADNNSDNDKSEKPDSPEAGKALAPTGFSPVNPFLAAAAADKADGEVAPRAFVSRMLDYSAHAAIIVGLIGFAWTVSDHVVNHPTAKLDTTTPVALAAEAPQPMDEIAQMRLANAKMHDEIKALKASVEMLRTAARHDTTPEQVRMLSAGLETMKASLGAANAAMAQLNGKIDKLQPSKIQQLTERVGKLEHQALDLAATASIVKSDPMKPDASKSAPKPPIKPTSLASGEGTSGGQDEDKPQVITGWVVRDVYRGVALVESKHGTMEVVPGVAIPGAGVVKSIERHGSGWTVTTSKGQFASATSTPQSQRDYRRGPYQGPYRGGGYPPYRYDY